MQLQVLKGNYVKVNDFFLFLFSFYFLQVWKILGSRIPFLFFLLFFIKFCFKFFNENEYCGRYSSVGLKWNFLSITCTVCKICNFQTSTLSWSQVTGTLPFYTVRIVNHFPQNGCVEGDGTFFPSHGWIKGMRGLFLIWDVWKNSSHLHGSVGTLFFI